MRVYDLYFSPIVWLLMCGFAPVAQADDWPSWRGANGSGTSVETKVPVQWKEPEGIRWKVELPGVGTSCPVIVGNSLYLTSSSGRTHDQLNVLCYDISNGSLRWHSKFFGTPTPVFTMFPPARGHAMPSVVANADSVIALFSTGELFSLDANGRLQWTRSLAADYGALDNDYGIAASPVLLNDRVLLQIDLTEGSYVLAVSLKDGRTLWKSERHEVSDNWSTPVVATIDSKHVLLCAGSKRLEAIDSASGKSMWTIDGLARLCCPTPILWKDSVIVTSGPGGNVQRIRLPEKADAGPRQLWQSVKGAGFVPSAICVEDLYFYGSDRGIVSCLDLNSGEELWQQRMGTAFRGSPVAAEGRVYFTTLDGKVTVIKAARQYEEVAVNDLGEQVSASPAIADRALFFRGEKHLICVGSKRFPVARLPASGRFGF